MKFTETHEWITVDHDVGTIGVTDYAQKELGEIVYVELPEVGKQVNVGDEVAVLESTKAASDIYSPVSGEITEVNDLLKNAPETINTSSEKNGWICKIRLSHKEEVEQLIDRSSYQAML